MMKLFLLSLLFVISFGANIKVSYVLCTSSTECSGDDCTTQEYEYAAGCVGANGVSVDYSCADGKYTTITYTDNDSCSGDGTEASFTSGECVSPGVGSYSWTCSEDSAISFSLLYGIISVFIVSLFQ